MGKKGIEPLPQLPQSYILPLNYFPNTGMAGLEPTTSALKTTILTIETTSNYYY